MRRPAGRAPWHLSRAVAPFADRFAPDILVAFEPVPCRNAGVGKGGRREALAINPQTATRIRAYLDATGHGLDIEGPLFRPLKHNGKRQGERLRMDHDAIDRVVRKYAAALGLDRGYSAHSMRATFITTALENGAQLENVQKAAGHRDPSRTKLYDRRGYNPKKTASFFAMLIKRKFDERSAASFREDAMAQREAWQLGGSAAELYLRYLVPTIASLWAADLIDRAAPRPGERVLDVACGTGVVSLLAAEPMGSGAVVGLDINAGMLAVARSLSPGPGPSIQWYEGSALAMPFPDASFDLCLCQLGLQFSPTGRLQCVRCSESCNSVVGWH
jgi:hypothetical protein